MASVTSLDKIVKNILLKRRYPLQYYIEFLVYGKDGLRELSFDLPMQTLRYQILTLDSNNEAQLPNDYSDWSKVSIRIGQYLHPLVEDNSLDTIPNFDSSFIEQPYINGVASLQPSLQQYYYPSGYLGPYWWMTNYNSFGENTGRMFGGTGAMADTFKIDKSRNILKINEYLTVQEAVLEYIGDGTDADSATHIEPYSQATIEAYAMWQFKESNRTYSEGEAQVAKQDYIRERQILTARFSDLTIDKFKRVVQGNNISVKY